MANPTSASLYNPYSRSVSSTSSNITNLSVEDTINNFDNRPVFTGSDLQAYINNVHVGNLESLTYSTNREVVGVYAMGNASPVNFAKGKRMVVGSMMFAQFDAHAVMEGVFKLQTRIGGPIASVGDLWKTLGASLTTNTTNVGYVTNLANVNGIVSGVNISKSAPTSSAEGANLAGLNLQGISIDNYNEQVKGQVNSAIQLVAGEQLLYPDQLPAFDLTLIGVNELGFVSKFALLGVTITQETGGWSLADLQNNIGLTYVAKKILYWRSDSNGNTKMFK